MNSEDLYELALILSEASDKASGVCQSTIREIALAFNTEAIKKLGREKELNEDLRESLADPQHGSD